MKRLSCALLALGLAGCGGVDVQGIVRDERTGEPLPGAKVMIGDEETATDYRGFFELEVDEDEASQMRVNKSGYQSYTESMTFDEGVGEMIQDVELAPAGAMGIEGSSPGSLEGTEGTLPPSGSNLEDEGLRDDGMQRDGLDNEGIEEDGTRGSQPGTYRGVEPHGPQPGTQPPAGWTPKEGWEPSDSPDGTTPPDGATPPSGTPR